MPSHVARLRTEEAVARRLAATFDDFADNAVCSAFEDASGQWHVAIHFGVGADEAALRALVARVAGEPAAQALAFEQIEDADWVAQSLADLKPVRAGRFVVHGAHDRARVPANVIGIEIEAALAFGTGHHGTTRGCLIALDALTKRTRRSPIPPLKGEGRRAQRGGVALQRNRAPSPPPGRFAATLPRKRGRDKRVLDVGTGSGVLAIAAAKALRTRAIASDIDRQAVAAAGANARLNHAGNFVTALRAVGTSSRAIAQHAPYDLIFANILLRPLTRLAVPLARLTRSGGALILSGLLPAHANAAIAIYRAQGLQLERRILLDDWVTLVFARARRQKKAAPGGEVRGGGLDEAADR